MPTLPVRDRPSATFEWKVAAEDPPYFTLAVFDGDALSTGDPMGELRVMLADLAEYPDEERWWSNNRVASKKWEYLAVCPGALGKTETVGEPATASLGQIRYTCEFIPAQATATGDGGARTLGEMLDEIREAGDPRGKVYPA